MISTPFLRPMTEADADAVAAIFGYFAANSFAAYNTRPFDTALLERHSSIPEELNLHSLPPHFCSPPPPHFSGSWNPENANGTSPVMPVPPVSHPLALLPSPFLQPCNTLL